MRKLKNIFNLHFFFFFIESQQWELARVVWNPSPERTWTYVSKVHTSTIAADDLVTERAKPSTTIVLAAILGLGTRRVKYFSQDEIAYYMHTGTYGYDYESHDPPLTCKAISNISTNCPKNMKPKVHNFKRPEMTKEDWALKCQYQQWINYSILTVS